MASVDILDLPSQGGKVLIYDLDQPVGPNLPNRRDDVLLVQYMMREVPKSGRFKPDPFPAPLTVDGVPGPGLFANIKHFQNLQKLRLAGKHSATDGRIDPIPSTSAISTTGVQYNMVTLNLAFQVSRPKDYPLMAAANDCPNELRPKVTPRFLVNLSAA